MKLLSLFKNRILAFAFISGLFNMASAQNDSILFHDGTFEAGFYNSLDSNWAQYLIRVTPTAYPAQLMGVRAWFKDPADLLQRIRFVAYKDLSSTGVGAGTSAAIYTSPNPLAVPVGAITTLYEDLSGSNLQIATGDFYVGISQTKRPSTIALDHDTIPGYYLYQWYRTSVFSIINWVLLNTNYGFYGQYGITAYWRQITTGVEENEDFYDNINIMPNPVNNNTAIYWNLSKASKVTVELYNLVGQLEKTLVPGLLMASGDHSVNLNASEFADGIYLCRFNVNGVVVTKKITVSH